MTPDIQALIAEAKRLDGLATEGPWEYQEARIAPYSPSKEDMLKFIDECWGENPDAQGWGAVFSEGKVICVLGNGPTTQALAQFIAHSRIALPALVAEVEWLQKKVTFYEEQAHEMNNTVRMEPTW